MDRVTKILLKKHVFIPLGSKTENEILFFSITNILKLPTRKVNPFFFFLFFFFFSLLLWHISGLSLLMTASLFITLLKVIWNILQDLVLPCTIQT